MEKIIYPQEISLKITAPPSKSIAIRALFAVMLAELSKKNNLINATNNSNSNAIHNYPACDDAETAKNCAESLGFGVFSTKNGSLLLQIDKELAKNRIVELDCGESGLCYRMLPFIAPHFAPNIKILATKKLRERANSRLFELLELFGIMENCTEFNKNINSDELIINAPITSGDYSIDCRHSSQELSGLLYSLPLCSGDSRLTVSNLRSTGYIDLTLSVLQRYGITISREIAGENVIFTIKGGQKFQSNESSVTVEGDWSSAAFFLVLGAIAGNVAISNLNIDSLQPDRMIFDFLKQMNIHCEAQNNTVFVEKSHYSGFEIDAKNHPDLIPALVVLAFNAKSGAKSKISGIERLINKESNRKEVLFKIFSLLGAKMRIENGSFIITASELSGGYVASHNDHRIAMAAAIAGFCAKNPIRITGAECVKKSFPEFWNYFNF